jgi:hypothetical protein
MQCTRFFEPGITVYSRRRLMHPKIPLPHIEFVSILPRPLHHPFVYFLAFLETLVHNPEHTQILPEMCGRLRFGIQYLYASDYSAFSAPVMCWFTCCSFLHCRQIHDQV